MENNLIISPPKNYNNELFWKAPNPMAITKAESGTYIDVNEAFTKSMGVCREELIGQTSVGCGYITVQQRALIANEIEEKGYAQNIKLEVRVKNNESGCGLFNSSMIKTGKDGLWLTVVTDISKRRQALEARQDDILFKSFAAIEETGVILIRGQRRSNQYLSFINDKAKMILNRRPLTDLLDSLDGHESTYFFNNKVCYRAKSILTRHGSPGKIILLEPLPDAVCIEEKLKQYDLTQRQKEIALLAARGDSNKIIAAKLFITEYTVKDHLKDIFQKFGVSKRSELCYKILR
ncbi:MAG: LuxR C-terminal-related transcriptional regulator [Smithella sp.]